MNHSFGSTLKKWRVRVHLTQVQVAKHLGYSNGQFISNIERGKSAPSAKNILSLGEIYKINPVRILAVVSKIRMQNLHDSLKKQSARKKK
jgi:transcriptional regulator with XRE-family HTH domain